MKKLAMVIEFVGAAIFFLCMCADATENPIVAVPTIISLLLLYAGSRIEGGWQDAEEDACKEAGMNDYLAKPVEPQRLYQVLAEYLENPM